MSPHANRVLLDALKLSPMERAELIEKLLASFPFPDRAAMDERWAIEAEDRLEAFARGDVKSQPASVVLSRVERGEIR